VLGTLQDFDDGIAVQGNEPANLQLIRRDALVEQELACFLDDAVGDPQPMRVTSASRGPISSGGGTDFSMPVILRMRFSIMARRLVALVYSSLMRTPFSSCSSLETVWVCRARRE